MMDSFEYQSTQRQLANKREHLLLIQERKSQFVLDTDVPLELIKEERETESEIATLEKRLAELSRIAAPQQSAPSPKPRRLSATMLAGIAVILLLLVFVVQIPKLFTKRETISPTVELPVIKEAAADTGSMGVTQQLATQEPTELISTDTPSAAARFVFPTSTPTPTMLAPVNLTNNREGSFGNLDLIYDDQGVLHMIFTSKVLRSIGDIFYEQLPPGGSWSAPLRLTEGMDVVWTKPSIALAPEGYVCVLWSGVSSGVDAAYKRCQVGADGSFSPMEIWNTRKDGYRPFFSSLLLPAGQVVAVFSELGDIFFQGRLIYDNVPSVASEFFVRDTAGGYHVVWFRQGTPYSLHYMSSSDGGNTWGEPQRLTGEDENPEFRFDLKADPLGNLHLVWIDKEVYYRKWSPDSGWGERVKISSNRCIPKVDTNTAGLARVAMLCPTEMYYIEQTADGRWTPPYQVAKVGSLDQGGIDIAVDKEDRANILWVGNGDILSVTLQGGLLIP